MRFLKARSTKAAHIVHQIGLYRRIRTINAKDTLLRSDFEPGICVHRFFLHLIFTICHMASGCMTLNYPPPVSTQNLNPCESQRTACQGVFTRLAVVTYG